jgi:hypothetical protein
MRSVRPLSVANVAVKNQIHQRIREKRRSIYKTAFEIITMKWKREKDFIRKKLPPLLSYYASIAQRD